MKRVTKCTAILFASLMVWEGFFSCSDSGDDSGNGNGQEIQNPTEKSIVISDVLESYTIGDNISFTVSFSNFETNPAQVKVYVNSSPVGDYAVLNNRVTFPSNGYIEGTYTFYVKSGDVKSNSLNITLTYPEETSYSFGPAGVALGSAMFTSLPGTAWADREGSLHDKWTFSTLSDGKIPVVQTTIKDDGTPYNDDSFSFNLDVASGVLFDQWGEEDCFMIYADSLLFTTNTFDKFERDGFSEGLAGKWVNDDGDWINITEDGRRTINNGVTSAAIKSMSNGVLYYKFGNVPQNLYYDGTYIYDLVEVFYPVE